MRGARGASQALSAGIVSLEIGIATGVHLMLGFRLGFVIPEWNSSLAVEPTSKGYPPLSSSLLVGK